MDSDPKAEVLLQWHMQDFLRGLKNFRLLRELRCTQGDIGQLGA
jgi:hypothetical protein